MASAALGIFFGGIITGVPVVTGVAEGVSYQKKVNEEANDDTRMIKSYLEVEFTGKSLDKPACLIVLKDSKLWITPSDPRIPHLPAVLKDGSVPHSFCGFYIMYPDENRVPAERGLVSTISVDPPMLNWIYVDKDSRELTYGNRTQSLEHIVGSWNWSEPIELLDDKADDGEPLMKGAEPRYITLNEQRVFGIRQEQNDRSDGLRSSLYLVEGKSLKGPEKLATCMLRRMVLPEELRKAQEAAADEKMRVKQSGDLKATLNLRGE